MNWGTAGKSARKAKRMAPNAANQISTGNPARARARAELGLSIVVPVFNEANGLPALHANLIEVARRLRETRGLATEMVYVDDGSRDATLSIAQGLPAQAVDVQVVSLSRNFGKE